MTCRAAADSPANALGGGRQAEQQKGGQVSSTVLSDGWYMASLDALLGTLDQWSSCGGYNAREHELY